MHAILFSIFILELVAILPCIINYFKCNLGWAGYGLMFFMLVWLWDRQTIIDAQFYQYFIDVAMNVLAGMNAVYFLNYIAELYLNIICFQIQFQRF